MNKITTNEEKFFEMNDFWGPRVDVIAANIWNSANDEMVISNIEIGLTQIEILVTS